MQLNNENAAFELTVLQQNEASLSIVEGLLFFFFLISIFEKFTLKRMLHFAFFLEILPPPFRNLFWGLLSKFHENKKKKSILPKLLG